MTHLLTWSISTAQTFLNVVRPAHSAEVFPVDADFELAVADVYSVPFVRAPIAQST